MIVRSLDDGTAVWLDPMRDVRSAAVGIYVAGGSADEAPGAEGSTHFLEHLLFKRTRRRSGAAIARTTDRLGGDCDAYTAKEVVAFHARTEASRIDDATDLLLDLTEAPAFTAADVEVERGVILEEMAEANDVPEDHLHDAFVRALWPSHPLGAPVLGTKASVSGLSRTALAARFRQIFRPELTAVVAVGAFEPERFLLRLQRAKKLRSQRARVSSLLSGPPAASSRRPRPAPLAFHVPRPELTQVHLLLGSATLAWGHPLVPAASLATVILGGGVSSRLWRDVRERRGLAYHVATGLTLHREAGLALIEAAASPKNLPALVRTTARAVRRLAADGPTLSELRRAQNQVRAEVALHLESTASRRESAARAWLYRGRPYEPDEYLADISAVTLDGVHEAMGNLYGRTPLGLGVAGPLLPGVSVDDLIGELAA